MTRVRAVDDRDFDAIAALTNEYIADTAIHFGYEKVTGAELRDAWWPKRALYPYLVAVDEGDRFLGYAKASAWRERAAYQWTAEVGIYVVAAAHRGGVGRALYGELIAQCKGRGFHTLVGGITLPNEASVRLHEALGFAKVAQFQRVGWKLGRWHDVGFWQLALAPTSEPAARLP